MPLPCAVVVMGVAGCGKSTVGVALASQLGWPFLEGDDFHPFANIEKMSRGLPLTDSDREPWLDALGRELSILVQAGRSTVASCSALKAVYRERLSVGIPGGVRFVHLRADRDELERRLRNRSGHFFDQRLLDSQLSTLESPIGEESIGIDATLPVAEIVQEAIERLALEGTPS